MKTPAVINLNFDSFSEAFGFPKGFRDPTYFEGADRFFSLINKYEIKISIYVIGRDLENPEIFARVHDWHQQGHEIGNHTWSHPMNFGSMTVSEIRQQICWCHEIVSRCTGEDPVGFVAPAWSTSKVVINQLIDLNYEYDLSVFPSLVFYPMIGKILLNHLNQPARLLEVLSRRDWLNPLVAPRNPRYIGTDGYLSKVGPGEESRLLVLPMPTINRLYPPYWHTLGYQLGWKLADLLLNRLLRKNEFMYYLLHPADFMGVEDVDSRYSHSLERLHLPRNEKLYRLESALDRLRDSKRPLVLMKDVHQYLTVSQ